MSKKLLNLLLVVMMLAVLVPTTLAAPPAQEGGQDYVVVADDWLSKLAEKYLGNPLAYPAIVEYTNQKNAEDASYAKITDPDLIEVGWKVYIPSAAEAEAYAGPPAAEKAGPKTIRFVMSESRTADETADPAYRFTRRDGMLVSSIGDQLIWLDDNFEIHPMLAESWEVNDAADEWTFHIRKGVKFHDGSELKAQDIVWCYRRILDPDTGSPGRDLMSGIDPEGIEALDDYTVRFKLPQPMVDLYYAIFNTFVWVVKEAPPEELRTNPIGTGPFKIEHFVPGEDPVILVKNEDYWMEGLPKVDRIEVRAVEEASSRTAALERNEVDVIHDPAPSDVAKLEANPDIDVASTKTGGWYGFDMLIDEPPYDDNRVRQALKLCGDRQKWVDLVLGGYGSAAHDVPVPPWIKFGVPDPPPERNIEKAKELLAEAGYPDGIDLELHVSEVRPGMLDLATLFKEDCAEAGINIELIVESPDTFWSEIYMKVPFLVDSWSGRPTDAVLALEFLSEAEWNFSHWNRPEWDEIVFEARRTVDEKEREELYFKAQRMLIEEGGVIVAFFHDRLAAKRTSVTGWRPGSRNIIFDFRTITLED